MKGQNSFGKSESTINSVEVAFKFMKKLYTYVKGVASLMCIFPWIEILPVIYYTNLMIKIMFIIDRKNEKA